MSSEVRPGDATEPFEEEEPEPSPLFASFGINAGVVEDLREQFEVDAGPSTSATAAGRHRRLLPPYR